MKPVTQELLRQAIDAFAFELPAGEAERFGASCQDKIEAAAQSAVRKVFGA